VQQPRGPSGGIVEATLGDNNETRRPDFVEKPISVICPLDDRDARNPLQKMGSLLADGRCDKTCLESSAGVEKPTLGGSLGRVGMVAGQFDRSTERLIASIGKEYLIGDVLGTIRIGDGSSEQLARQGDVRTEEQAEEIGDLPLDQFATGSRQIRRDFSVCRPLEPGPAVAVLRDYACLG
jgi:hypothetical protein